MAIWFRANKLAVNINKTKYMIFRMKGKKIESHREVVYDENESNIPHDTSLVTVLERYHDNHPTADCRTYKLLGIYLDEHLNLDTHVSHICNKLTRYMYCIKQAKHIITKRGLISLYYSLIHSHLTYCTSILYGITINSKNRIEKVQKKAIRIITNSAYNAHTLPLFLELGILPFNKLIQFSQLLFMHAVEYKYAPPSFNEIWMKNGERDPEIELRNANEFYLPMPRTETFKKSTYYALPSVWNDLPQEIKLQQNRITFKWALKDHLMSDLIEN
jgi:hypothetical protein